MITEDDLRAALHAHQDLAPDAAPVAARITAGVRTRRRHRYAGTVAVAVLTVAAVAVPTLVLRGAGPAPAQAPIQVAGQPQPPGAPPVRFTPLTLPFTVGWLPAGWFPDGTVDTDPGSALRMYENVRTGQQLAVRVWDTKVSGVPATEVLPVDGPTVHKQLSGTGWLAVGGPLPAADLDRLLRSVDVRDTEVIRFPFRATWLPAGYRPTGADSGLHHWFGNAAGTNVPATEPLVGAGLTLDTAAHPTGDTVNIGVSTEDGSWQDKGLRPTGTLLGRPSRYTLTDGLAVLHVYGVRGLHIQVNAVLSADRPELNRAALERIAGGLRFVDHPDRPSDWTDRPLP